MSTALQIENLHKSFGQITAIDDLSASLESGQMVGLIGPNGAGKSTLIHCIAGLLRPDSGNVSIQDIDMWENPYDAKKQIGYADQDPDLFEYLTGRELLEFTANIRGTDKKDEAIENLLSLTNLSDAADRLIKQYSGGMKRKISLCSALVGSPPLLLLDEALTGLDPESTTAVESELRARLDNDQNFVLFCSHMLDLLQRICDQFIILKNGKIISQFSDEQMRNRFSESDNCDSLNDIYLEETQANSSG